MTSQTIIFSALLLTLAVILGFKKSEGTGLTKEKVKQVKGLAILLIILSHIGYFLVADHRFLVPLSNFAGVGVDLFLLTSGFGLTLSQLKKNLSPLEFYKARLSKIYLPLIIALIIILITERLILSRFYNLAEILSSFLGFFPQANIINSLDSPLWYFTFILWFYFIFPWAMKIKFKFMAPIIVVIATVGLLKLNLPVAGDVKRIYELHLLSFPLGMALGLLTTINIKAKLQEVTRSNIFKVVMTFIATLVFIYASDHSGVGRGNDLWEQLASIAGSLSVITIFILIPLEVKLLKLLGDYSYEIYLLHWPLLLRFDVIFKLVTTGIATFIYIPLLIGLGNLFRRLATLIEVTVVSVKNRIIL